MEAKDDPTIKRIRDARQKISEECGHDPGRMVEYYSKLQKKYEGRIIINTEGERVPDGPVKV